MNPIVGSVANVRNVKEYPSPSKASLDKISEVAIWNMSNLTSPLSPVTSCSTSSYSSASKTCNSSMDITSPDMSIYSSSSSTLGSLSGNKTPTSSTKKRKPEETPIAKNTPERIEKIKKTVLLSSVTKPLSNDRQSIVENMSAIMQKAKNQKIITSPEVKDLKNTLRAKCAMGKTTNITTSPYTQNSNAIEVYGISPWAKQVEWGINECIAQEENTPDYIDMKHILDQQRSGGFHFCPFGDPKWDNIRNRTVSVNGVVSGEWLEKNGNWKMSSFFPPELKTERNVFDLIKAAKKTEDRSAFPRGHLFKDKDLGLHIEAFTDKNNPAIFKSVYPIFKFIDKADLDEGVPVQITKESVEKGVTSPAIFKTPQEINGAIGRICVDWLANKVENSPPFSYTNTVKSTVLIDIASKLGVGVSKGILVEVPMTTIETLGINRDGTPKK